MLRVEEARDLILRHAPVRRVATVPLDGALGLVLAGDVASPEPLPAFPRSGMDGYALRAADSQAATRERPIMLPLHGVIPAGHPLSEALPPGTCASIMTGGAVPAGADAVIRLEEVRVTPEGVRLYRPVTPGENVGPAGEDVAEGQTILRAGHRIRPAEIHLLAAIGVQTVAVYQPPRVGILCTGDEIVPAGEPLGPGQIRNSNGPGLTAMIRAAGCVPVNLGMAHDVADAIADVLSRAVECDVVVTTGGVSVGDFDVAREAMSVAGGNELFWRVAIKPGMPACAALLGDRIVIGLSGNPAAAITNFDLLVRPLLDWLMGKQRVGLRETEGVLDQPVLRQVPLTRYLRARVYRSDTGELRIDTGMAQRTGVLSSMVAANAYAVIPDHSGPTPAGERVRVLLHEEAEV